MHNAPFTRRQSLQWAAALAASSSLPSFAQSEWPKEKTITFIVPFTASPTAHREAETAKAHRG